MTPTQATGRYYNAELGGDDHTQGRRDGGELGIMGRFREERKSSSMVGKEEARRARRGAV